MSSGNEIDAKRATAVAHADAERVYRDLSRYHVRVVLADDGWHVDYDVQGPDHKGGGPHYVIDPLTGAIKSKRYKQ